VLVIENNLNIYFSNQLERLKTDDIVRAYIVSVLTKYKNTNEDYSKESLTLKYIEAKNRQEFRSFQDLGDYIFFASSIFPESLNNASMEYYYGLGQSSYHYCYILIQRKLPILERLADEFIELTNHTREIIFYSQIL
jgi:hypothetical protein